MFEKDDPLKLEGEERENAMLEMLVNNLAVQKILLSILVSVVSKPEDPGLNTLTNDELMAQVNAEVEKNTQSILESLLGRRGTIKNLNSLLGLTPKPPDRV